MPGSCYSACYSIRPDRAGSSGLQRSEGPLTRTGAGSARLRRRTGSLLQGGGRGFESLSAHRNPGQWHFATGLGLPPRWNSNLGVELNGPAGARRRSLSAGAGGRLGVAASQSGSTRRPSREGARARIVPARARRRRRPVRSRRGRGCRAGAVPGARRRHRSPAGRAVGAAHRPQTSSRRMGGSATEEGPTRPGHYGAGSWLSSRTTA